MEFQGKILLILAGAGTQVKVVRTAKEISLNMIVTDYLGQMVQCAWEHK